jgi:hypothetical protein
MPNSSTKFVVVGLLVAAVAAAVLYGQRFGDLSDNGYEIALSLFSACNRRDSNRIPAIEAQIDLVADQGELGKQEAKWLRAVVLKAKAEKWEAAQRDIRNLMEQQVKETELPQLD